MSNGNKIQEQGDSETIETSATGVLEQVGFEMPDDTIVADSLDLILPERGALEIVGWDGNPLQTEREGEIIIQDPEIITDLINIKVTANKLLEEK